MMHNILQALTLTFNKLVKEFRLNTILVENGMTQHGAHLIQEVGETIQRDFCCQYAALGGNS